MTGVSQAIDVRVETGFAHALDRLAERAGDARGFLRAAWYGAGREAHARTLVATRGDGGLLAAIPTVELGPALVGARGVPGSYWPFRALALAPDARVDEVAALLATPAAEALLAPVWRLGPVYADDPCCALLRRGAVRAGWTVLTRALGPTYRLDLTAPDAWPRRSTRRRLAGYERGLAAGGAVTCRTVTGDDWDEATFAALAAVEARSWVGTATDRRGAKFLTAAQRGRWWHATRDPHLARALSATILSVAGEPVAFSFDLAAGTVQYAIASSYDARFAAARPGRIVTARQLARAAAAGIRTVDLGAGDSGYKREMGATAGAAIVDLLLVRSRATAQLMAWRWGAMSPIGGDFLLAPARPAAEPRREGPRARLRGLVPPLIAAGALAAVALSAAE